jgi:hypothetical protein
LEKQYKKATSAQLTIKILNSKEWRIFMCWWQFFISMKLILTLTISILLFSCGATTSEDDRAAQSDENWEITNHTFTTNNYNSRGLLDTSYQTILFYQMGILLDTIKSFTVRKYDQNRLTNEKQFTLEKDGSKTLSNETVKHYDSKGNLITEIRTLSNKIFSKTIKEYNDKGQVTKTFNIFQKMDDNPADYNLDSAVAHRHDKRQFQYDTTISTFEYDDKDNVIRVIISDTKQIVHKISVTQYSGHEKIFSFSVTPDGDTTAKYIFKREGSLIKEIADVKELGELTRYGVTMIKL